jgi:hypothetical protein
VCVAKLRCPYEVSGSNINIAAIDFQDCYRGPYILSTSLSTFLFFSNFPNLSPRRLIAVGFKSKRVALVSGSAPLQQLQIEHEAIYDVTVVEELLRPYCGCPLGTINSITLTCLVSYSYVTLLNINAPRLQKKFFFPTARFRCCLICDALNVISPMC